MYFLHDYRATCGTCKYRKLENECDGLCILCISLFFYGIAIPLLLPEPYYMSKYRIYCFVSLWLCSIQNICFQKWLIKCILPIFCWSQLKNQAWILKIIKEHPFVSRLASQFSVKRQDLRVELQWKHCHCLPSQAVKTSQRAVCWWQPIPGVSETMISGRTENGEITWKKKRNSHQNLNCASILNTVFYIYTNISMQLLL